MRRATPTEDEPPPQFDIGSPDDTPRDAPTDVANVVAAVPFTLNPKQLVITRLFAQANARHNLIYGGARSGKTFLLTRATALRTFSKPQARSVIIRRHLQHVKESVWLDTLPKVLRLCWPGYKPIVNNQDLFMIFPDSKVPKEYWSELWCAGLDDKDRTEKILGKEFSTIYFNECSQIGYQSVLLAWTRLAKKVPGLTNKAFYDLNPTLLGHWSARLFKQHIDPLSRERAPIPDPEDYVFAYLNPEDNKENIDPKVLIQLRNLPLAQRKRFYEGEYSAEMAGQLWAWDTLSNIRHAVVTPQQLESYGIRRVVIAVDPSGASGEQDMKADEIGICVVAMDEKKKGYLLEDASGLYAPEQWSAIVSNLYTKWNADLVVGEKNFGGDMVRAVIHAKNRSIAFKAVTASRGKAVRAEPIASYYTQGMVVHCGEFPILEDELSNFTTSGYIGEGSPNHADALVWGFTELFEGNVEIAWVDTMKALAQGLEDNTMALTVKGQIVKIEEPEDVAKVTTSAMIKPAVVAATDACPKCGSTALARIGTMKRCGQCGEQLGRTGVDASINSMGPAQRNQQLNK